MNTSIISIIMPVYNSSLFIREAIDSILQQTFINFELIVVDDESTDDSVSIVNSYNDKRIRLLLNEHDFIGSLNLGIHNARGKYIARMDADDVMLPDRLQKQVDYMERHPEIAVCGSWAKVFGAGEGMIRTITDHEEIVSSMLLYNPMVHPSVIIRKSVFENNLYQTGYPCAEDYKLWTELASKEFRFVNIPEVLLKYRRSANQVTQTRQEEMFQSNFRIQMEYAEQIMEQLAERDDALVGFLNELIELVNENRISGHSLIRIVHTMYTDILNNKK